MRFRHVFARFLIAMVVVATAATFALSNDV